MSTRPCAPINQVCTVARDGARTARWYTEGLGMLPAGHNVFFGKLTERVQAVPDPLLHAFWALDRQGFFQVEIFQYRKPRSRPRPLDWSPADWGYSMTGLHVRDFDQALDRLAVLGSLPYTDPVGPAGDRRVCVPDPDGNLVELLERDPLEPVAPTLERPDLGATVRFLTVSVPDLEAFCERAERGLGLVREDLQLHAPEHARLWGLEGAKRRSAVLRGGGVALEVVQYERPEGRPWPDGYRLSDLGYMNFAVGFRDTGDFDRSFAQAQASGWTPHGKPLEVGVFKVMYVDDADGFDVEMLRPRTWADRLTGFAPSMPYAAAERYVNAAPEIVWEQISDLAGMESWSDLPVQVDATGPAGVGTRRRLKMFGKWVTEEIVAWHPPNGYAYRLVSGAPLADHHGELSVSAEGSGACVRWAVRFRSRVPLAGPIIAAQLQRRLSRALAGLATAFVQQESRVERAREQHQASGRSGRTPLKQLKHSRQVKRSQKR
jgi:catechol 2,3-dioxygenase-like lactoylglutathione lyase family enzyme